MTPDPTLDPTPDRTLDPADVPLDDVLAAMVVVDVPMHVRFRGVDHREVVLLQGPRGWGEFSPFVEYDDRESSWWLASALESAWSGWPEPLRDRRAGERHRAGRRAGRGRGRCWRASRAAAR